MPFFQRYFQKNIKAQYNLADFPITCKEDYQEYTEDFLSPKFKTEQLKIIYTSGSTGNPMKIYKTNRDYIEQTKNIWAVRSKNYHIRTTDRELKFIFANVLEYNMVSIDYRNHSMSVNIITLTEEWLKKNYTLIEEYQPQYIIGYSSIISNVIRLYENIDREFPKSIEYIELLGEYVFDFQKKYIKEKTNAVVVNSYGTSEVFGIAYECKAGCLHCLDKNTYVEIVSDDRKSCGYEEEGNIILTAYNSEAMPFIRYETGDKGRLRSGSICSCGDKHDVLEIKAGRIYDFLIMEDGEKKHVGFFYGIIGVLNKKFCDSILQFEIVQNTYKKITVNLLLSKKYMIFSDSIKKDFINLANQLQLDDFEWDFHFVARQNMNMAKKHKFFRRGFDLET